MARARRSIRDVKLTAREVDILETAAKGLSSEESSAALGLTVGTIHTYKKRIYKKLGVSSLLAAVYLWQRRNHKALDEKLEKAAQAFVHLGSMHLINEGISQESLGAVLARASELATDRKEAAAQ